MGIDLECELCGGTNFYKESGFYYCNECQTQTQEIREHVFEQTTHIDRGKVIQQPESKSQHAEQYTSWECYNYILLGLANELIELGATRQLKQVVRVLWFKYLKRMEVINDKVERLPKLQAVNSKMDAQILYGLQPKVRKRKRSASSTGRSLDTLSNPDSVSKRREGLKKQKEMVQSQYEEYRNLQAETTSLHNQSLLSLRSSSDASSKNLKTPIAYNSAAMKELKKVMASDHLAKHGNDKDNDLSCHKFTYRTTSAKYLESAEMLTRSRIFALLYIALLINKEKIQLGDMLRYIREGHLSYKQFTHFFPESMANKKLNIGSYAARGDSLTHHGIRELAAKLLKFLRIEKYIPVQNIVELSERYCQEMNLPDEVYTSVLSLISRTQPKMQLNGRCIPNYEGRAVSYIIFVLKLLFGLDDATEDCFSTYADCVNAEKASDLKMFNFKRWITFIEYRKLVISQHHFPTDSLHDKNFERSETFINFLEEHNSKYDISTTRNTNYEILENLLTKLAGIQESLKTPQNFPVTLTPFQSYLRIILDSKLPKEERYLRKILKRNYKYTSLDFLIEPVKYLETINSGVEIKHSGAQQRLDFVDVFLPRKETNLRRNLKKTAPVVIYGVKMIGSVPKPECLPEKKKKNREEMLDYYNKEQAHSFLLNKKKYESLNANANTNSAEYEVHYHPHERFWLKSEDVSFLTKEQFQEFMAKLPFSFQLVMKECARVTEQTCKDLFHEYNILELHLCYKATYKKTGKVATIFNNDLKHLVDRMTKFF